tara:strand:+ start:74 stop:388 length:315 start_codon:yes stop_codon:yes gene_type:complete
MILLGLLYSCHPVHASFLSAKPVVCGTVDDVVDTSANFGESPLLRGKGTALREDGTFSPSQYIIGYNEETETWSLIEILSNGLACVLGTGKGLEIFTQEKGMAL